MDTLTLEQITDVLTQAGNQAARVVQYAHTFLEYCQACENIDKNGLIVGHPKTGAPIANPYMAVRDRALKKLGHMYDVKGGDVLWQRVFGVKPVEVKNARRGRGSQ